MTTSMTESNRPEVFVIRANDMAFMGLLRSVNAAGSIAVPVIYDWPGAPDWTSSGSKYFRNAKEIANPVTQENAAVEKLLELGYESLKRTGRKPLVLPSSDTILMLFLDNEEQLSDVFELMGHENYSTFRSEITHKAKFFEILQKAIPEMCPVTMTCSKPEQISQVVSAAKFPVIVKPAVKDYGQSFYRYNNGAKAITIPDASQLTITLEDLIEKGFDLLVQEKIEFHDARDEIPFYAAVDANSHIRIAATGIKEFLQPAPFGTATVLRLTWHEELLPLAQKVAAAIKWRGTLMIEFIRDLKDGRWKIIEVNTRPWLFQDFYQQFGLAFVPFAIRDHAERNLKPVTDTIVPSATLTNTVSPVHLDIPTICAEILATPPSDKVAKVQTLADFIHSYSQNYTLAHGSNHDPGSLEIMLGKLAQQHNLDGMAIRNLLVDNQFDYTRLQPLQSTRTTRAK